MARVQGVGVDSLRPREGVERLAIAAQRGLRDGDADGDHQVAGVPGEDAFEEWDRVAVALLDEQARAEVELVEQIRHVGRSRGIGAQHGRAFGGDVAEAREPLARLVVWEASRPRCRREAGDSPVAPRATSVAAPSIRTDRAPRRDRRRRHKARSGPPRSPSSHRRRPGPAAASGTAERAASPRRERVPEPGPSRHPRPARRPTTAGSARSGAGSPGRCASPAGTPVPATKSGTRITPW